MEDAVSGFNDAKADGLYEEVAEEKPEDDGDGEKGATEDEEGDSGDEEEDIV